MSSGWTPFLVAEHEARVARGKGKLDPGPVIGVPVIREALLQRRMFDDLMRRRLLFLHNRMDVPTTNHEDGPPDFIIFAPGARIIMPECKSATGKLSEAQMIWHERARMAGFEVPIVRSFEHYAEIVR